MDAERIRAYLLTLPHAVETMQWGATLVFWTCDKSIGGKMFAILNFNEPSAAQAATGKPHRILSYAAGPERFSELVELEGLTPAPYLARAHWIAADRWDVFTPAEWRRELAAAPRPDHRETPTPYPQSPRPAPRRTQAPHRHPPQTAPERLD